MANVKYCDHCKGVISDESDYIYISVYDRTNKIIKIGGEDFDLHKDCFNRLFSTDYNLIFNYLQNRECNE